MASLTEEKRPIDGRRLKISGTGWLCAFDRGEWIAVLKLTDEQVRIYREFAKTVEAIQ